MQLDNAEHFVTRWREAGLLDEQSSAAIRAYEAAQERPRGRQWQVLLVLILGGILLGAGVLLFVAAHWEKVSPLSRLLLVLSMLVFFHGMGLLVADRFPGLATAMHAVGTVSAGAAIALVGQIFNMQEHWPAAVLLWALCAGAGWWLLRDQFQETLTLLLVPAWIVCEWIQRTDGYGGSEVYIARIGAVLAAVYLVAFLHARRRAVSGILFAVGAVMLPVSVAMLSHGWIDASNDQEWGFVPPMYRFAAFAIIVALVVVGFVLDKRSAVPTLVIAGLALGLPWTQKIITETFNGYATSYSQLSVLGFAMVAAAAVFLVWWGVRTSAKALVNFGMAAFALTVAWFYSSNVMDKLGRSLGLIMLGVLFLAGGWLLERMRRRLVGGMVGAA